MVQPGPLQSVRKRPGVAGVAAAERQHLAERVIDISQERWSLKSLALTGRACWSFTPVACTSTAAPGGYVQLPGRRWLRFPVRGTGRSNAIMTAVDQVPDRPLARDRDHRPPRSAADDELILKLALTARWVSSFFGSSGGGG